MTPNHPRRWQRSGNGATMVDALENHPPKWQRNGSGAAGALLVGALGLAFALSADADVVELKTGQRVEGTLKQATPASVSIEVGGQTITFEGAKVRAIYFGTAPSAVAAAPSARAEALRALKALKSVTDGGVNYREYSTRVNDAKIVVDRFLEEPGSDPGKAEAKAAMYLYQLASQAWNTRVSRGTLPNAVGLDTSVKDCVPAREVISKELAKQKDWQGTDRTLGAGYSAGAVIAFYGLPALWSCAADKIAAAEKLIGASQ